MEDHIHPGACFTVDLPKGEKNALPKGGPPSFQKEEAGACFVFFFPAFSRSLWQDDEAVASTADEPGMQPSSGMQPTLLAFPLNSYMCTEVYVYSVWKCVLVH